MKVNDARTPRRLMLPINILGKQHFDPAMRLQLGQSVMSRVGLSQAKTPPADKAARPVALTGGGIAHECLIGDGLDALPLTIGVAIVGNTRPGAAPGPGEHKQPLMAGNKPEESFGGCHDSDLRWSSDALQFITLGNRAD